MRYRKLAVALCALALVAAACSDDDDSGGGDDGGDGGGEPSGELTLMSAGTPDETEAYQEIFDELINAEVDYTVTVESVGDFEEQVQIRGEGGTLQVAAVPQPGTVQQMAAEGQIQALEDMGVDVAALEELVGADFLALGEVDGKHYGVPTNINLKSMVWYPKDDFDEKGYEVPETWDDLVALSDQIVTDGGTPWCVGFESEGATGWPATDWMEDIMLRTAGADVYDQWVNHEIPFNDPAVVTAGERFGEILFTDGYVLGGAAATADLAFADAPAPLFTEPDPGCYLHRQASFIAAQPAFEGQEAGVDFDWFPLPPIDQDGTLYAGELTVVGTDADPDVAKDFLDRFIAENVQCAMGGVQASSRISPNVNVGPDCYTDELLAGASEVLTEALASGTGRFDASDLMPAEVGSGSFWTGMIVYVRDGPGSLDGVLTDIEDSWPSS
jgi:alpha-glucoside transport system substrate-binding protein